MKTRGVDLCFISEPTEKNNDSENNFPVYIIFQPYWFQDLSIIFLRILTIVRYLNGCVSALVTKFYGRLFDLETIYWNEAFVDN